MSKRRNSDQQDPSFDAVFEILAETKTTRVNTRHSYEEKRKYEKIKNPRKVDKEYNGTDQD